MLLLILFLPLSLSLSKNDLRPSKIKGIALCGGGHHAFVNHHANLHAFYHTLNDLFADDPSWTPSIWSLLNNRIIGTNSAGGWFLSSILYWPDFAETLENNNEETKAAVIEMIDAIGDQVISMWQEVREMPESEEKEDFIEKKMNNRFYSLLDSLIRPFLSDETQSCDNPWGEIIKAYHHRFSDSTDRNVHNITWISQSALKRVSSPNHSGMRGKKVELNRAGEDSKWDNELFHGYIPAFLEYKVSSGGSILKDLSIPLLEDPTAGPFKLHLDKPDWFSLMIGRPDESTFVDLPTDQLSLKEAIKNAFEPTLNDPKILSAPSACALDFKFPSFLQGFFPDIYSRLSWTSRPLDVPTEDIQPQIQLTDGAVIDNNGLVATLKGLQEKYGVEFCTFDSCTVVIFAEEDAVSMGVMFGDNGKYWAGLFGQESHKYVKSHGVPDCPIHQRMLIGCEETNTCEQLVDESVDASRWICRIGAERTDVDPIVKVYEANLETVERPEVDIQAGMKFKAVIIGYKYGMYNNILNFLLTAQKDIFVEAGRIPLLGPRMGKDLFPLWQRINHITRNAFVTEFNKDEDIFLSPWEIVSDTDATCNETDVLKPTPVFDHCESQRKHVAAPFWFPLCK